MPVAPPGPAGPDAPAPGEPARDESAAAADGSLADDVPVQPPLDDDWEMQQRLQHIDRILNRNHDRSGRPQPEHEGAFARLDPPHELPSSGHLPAAAERTAPLPAKKQSAGPGDALLAVAVWLALSLGITALMCGGILLGWSVLGGRTELWSIGMPIAVVGQIALVLGLILQLDRIWHNHLSTAEKLTDVGRQIHDLKAATAMLGTTHCSPASAFYAHYSGGANPQMLLADLKGQLDLLAVKLDRMDP
jgi:hypothetical protein